MHPLHTQKWIDEAVRSGHPLRVVTSRYTGRSTAQALWVLSQVIKNPGVEFKVHDHYPGEKAADFQLQMLREMIDRLELKHIHINRAEQTIIFENRERNKCD